MDAERRTSLRGLRTFCVAARHESFRLAGEELYVTASAVSRQIKSLEEELGLQLFERSSRDLKLTATGKALYEDVSPLIDEIDNAVARYRPDAPARHRLVRMSVQPFFASEVFVPRLSEFTSANPHIDIRVATSDESQESHPADADLSIRLFRSPPAGLQSEKLMPLRVVPAGSPDFKHQLRVENNVIVSDFPIIVHESFTSAWSQWSQAAGIRLPPRPKVTRLSSMIAVVRAVEQGIGAGLVAVPAADLWFKYGSIVRLFSKELEAGVSYFLVWRSDVTDDPDIRRLREWILRIFAADA